MHALHCGFQRTADVPKGFNDDVALLSLPP
jgi:hypothetical protein